jgi:hypothetical protein
MTTFLPCSVSTNAFPYGAHRRIPRPIKVISQLRESAQTLWKAEWDCDACGCGKHAGSISANN